MHATVASSPKNNNIYFIIMDLSLSQLEDLTKDEKPPVASKGRSNIERKIQLAMKKKSNNDESLQQYTNNKIKNIYKLLDDVDEVKPSPTQVVDYLEREHEYQSKIAYLSGTNQTQQIELEEARRTIENLKSLLEKSQVRIKEQEVLSRELLNTRLSEQKQELETVINRHLGFIDQLLADKRDLNTQVETLTNDLKGIDEKTKKVLNEQKLQFQRELKQTKDAWIASEKQRKERWQTEKVAEIKEQTIRGLEPEIERMVEKHRKDVKKVEERCQREIEAFKMVNQEEFDQKLRAAREKMIAENDVLIKREREAISSRTKDSYEKFNRELEVERERIKQRYEQDLQDVERRRKDEADGYVKRFRMFQEEQAEETRRVKTEAQQQVDEMRQQQMYLEKVIKDQLKGEQQQWMDQQLVRMQSEMQKKLNQEQSRMEKERNEQIELILQKLASEQACLEKEISGKYEKRIRDQQTNYEEEKKLLKRQLKTLEEHSGKSEQTTQSSLETLGKQYLDLQNQYNLLSEDLKQTKQTLTTTQEQLRTTQEESTLKIRGMKDAWDQERRQLQHSINELNGDMSEQKMSYEHLFQEQEYKHANELEQVESRVTKVITKNQMDINKLREEVKMKELACAKYEEMLRRQREDLLQKLDR